VTDVRGRITGGRRAAGEAAKVPSVGGAVAKFVLASLVAVVVFFVGTLFVVRELGRREAVRNARELAQLAGQGIVEPTITSEVLAGRRSALSRLDRVVQERVLSDRVVRIKIWTRGGRIVYSDEPRLIGSRYHLPREEQEVLVTGVAHAELSDLAKAENRYERGQGKLLEVYVPIRAPDGTPLLFEMYERVGSILSSSRTVWLPVAFVLLVSLVLLWLVQVPLAWSLGRRLEQGQRERELLLVKAIEASEVERRRIAGDLHDGVVQDLAGISYSLAAAAGGASDGPRADLMRALDEAASGTRESVRRLRSLLVEIHPPNLHAAGLEAALSDLLAPLTARGVAATLDVSDGLTADPDAEALIYRAAGEAIRNVGRHAHAKNVSVRVTANGAGMRLEVSDDGRGFSPEERERRRGEGHLGLSLLEEMVQHLGGSLEIRSQPGAGTTVAVELPST
jgi:two-component system NarL family sensor kinase